MNRESINKDLAELAEILVKTAGESTIMTLADTPAPIQFSVHRRITVPLYSALALAKKVEFALREDAADHQLDLGI